jgi:type I restriction enzyme S subunit
MRSAEGWQDKSLRELATINYGRSPSGILSEDGMYPVVGTGGDERVGNDYLYDGDSIIMGRKGSIDRVHFATGRFWVIDTAYYLSNFIESVPRWLFFFLQTLDLRQLNEATGVPSLSRELLYKIEVPTPSEPEQTKIAQILSMVDKAIEQTQALIAKQQSIKTGLMQDLLSRGIDEHGRLRSDSTHHFNDSPLGRIPTEWRVASVGELFEQRTEHGRPGLPVMSIVMKDGLVDRASVERRVESNLPPEGHALVLEGDIAYNMMRMWQGVLGRASFDCLVSPAYIVLKPGDEIDTRFAEWLFRDQLSILKFRQASRGVVDDRLRLYPRDLFSIKFAVPRSLEEQRAISQRLEAMKAHIASETAALEKHRALRVGLMQDLLTGKKRVTPLLELELTH